MPYHTYYHCSCQVICVTYSHAVSPSGYTDVQKRSTFLGTIIAYIVCMVRIVCISCQACCVSTLLCWQNFHKSTWKLTFSTTPFLICFYCLDCQVWVTSIGPNFIFVGSTPSFSPTPFTIVGTMHRTWWILVGLLLGNLFYKIPQSMRLIDDGEHRCRGRKR